MIVFRHSWLCYDFDADLSCLYCGGGGYFTTLALARLTVYYSCIEL